MDRRAYHFQVPAFSLLARFSSLVDRTTQGITQSGPLLRSHRPVVQSLDVLTEQEIEEMKQQINNEIEAGQVLDPLDQVAQDKQSAEIDMETQKVNLDNLKNPPEPKTSGSQNTK